MAKEGSLIIWRSEVLLRLWKGAILRLGRRNPSKAL